MVYAQSYPANTNPASIFSSLSEKVQYWATVSCLIPTEDNELSEVIEEKWFLEFILLNYEKNGDFRIPKNSKLLLKLGDGSTLTLFAYAESEAKYQFETTGEYWQALGSYQISAEDLARIMDKGVLKVRFQTEPKYFEHAFKKDAIGKILKKCHAAVLNNLKEDF